MIFDDLQNWSGAVGYYTEGDLVQITTEVNGVKFTSGFYASEEEARFELRKSIDQYFALLG